MSPLRRLLTRGRREEGQVLLLTLGFIVFVGVIAVPLASYATTNLRVTPGLREVRSAQFTSAAAVEGALNAVRRNPALASQSGCFSANLNGSDLRVDCSMATVSANITDVTFTACPTSVSAPCPAADAILLAEVRFNRVISPALVRIKNWSVRR